MRSMGQRWEWDVAGSAYKRGKLGKHIFGAIAVLLLLVLFELDE